MSVCPPPPTHHFSQRSPYLPNHLPDHLPVHLPAQRWRRAAIFVGALIIAMLFLVWLALGVGAVDRDAQQTLFTTNATLGGRMSIVNQKNGQDLNSPTDNDEIEISGIVLNRPSDPQGQGEWRIRAQSGRIYRVIADEDTEFESALPTINQTVKAKGKVRHRSEGDEILAEKIEVDKEGGDGSGGDEQNELEGILDAEAPAGGSGTWVIRTGAALTISVIANENTRIEEGVPAVGSWITVRGNWQSDTRFLATRIRFEHHEISEVVVRLKDGVDATAWANQHGLVLKQTLLASGNIHLFTTRDDEEESSLAQIVADTENVHWAELNYVGGISEGHGYKTWRWGGTTPDGYVNQDAFAQIDLAPALETMQGNGIVIAILDTGVNQSHTAFSGRLLPGYDMIAEDADPEDEGDGLGWGHGTHIAGIIAQTSPQSKLLPVRVLNSNGRGNTFALAYGIEWAVEQGADVINLSLGADAHSQVLKDVISQAIADGVIVVAAAGNMGNDVPQFPASLPAVISVTAVDANNVKADFANYGAGWVDLAAPGVGITSTIVGAFGSGYASWSGTSMATGFVSGAAALMRQKMPAASVDEISGALTLHAQNLDSSNPTYAGKLGGLLDVAAAMEVTDPVATATPLAPTPTNTGTQPTPTATVTVTPTPITPGTGDAERLFIPIVRR